MNAYLERLTLTREQVYITSAMRSRPYKEKLIVRSSGESVISRSNRTPTKAENGPMHLCLMKRSDGFARTLSHPWEIRHCTG